MTWQVLTATSVLGLSLSVLLQRILLHKDKIDPYAYAVVFQGIVGALLMIAAIINGFKLPGISSVLIPAVVSIVSFGIGHIFYAKTLQTVEASVFSVLFATQAIWIMLLGIYLFDESLSFVQLIGSLLIFSSVGLLVKSPRAFRFDIGMLTGLSTGLLFGIAITSWSYVGRHTDGLSWTAISFIGTAIVAYAAKPTPYRMLKSVATGKLLPKLLVLAILYGIGSMAMLYAYKEGSFAVVTPLRQSSIVVTVLLALLLINTERNRIAKKLIAAAICFIGSILIIM